jgi:hypothetical protein
LIPARSRIAFFGTGAPAAFVVCDGPLLSTAARFSLLDVAIPAPRHRREHGACARSRREFAIGGYTRGTKTLDVLDTTKTPDFVER